MKDSIIISLEKDLKRYEYGLSLINEFNKNIKLINTDFFEFIKENKTLFDLVFIDGAKARYIDYIKTIKDYLKNEAVVISDNIFLRNKIFLQNPKKNEERMIKKMNEFIDYIKSNDNFETIFLEIGDCVAISIYKGKNN